VQGLEQVRLAGPVRPRHQHDARLELELEPLVRAKVSEDELANDQAAD
jgi:hypothetical protein